MKKILVIVLFLVAGCSSSITTVESDIWRFEESYNMQANTKAQQTMMIELENELMYFIPTVEDGNSAIVTLYSDKDGEDLTVVNEKSDKDCSIDNLKKCANTKKGHLSMFHYYNDSLYYVYGDVENDKATYTLYRRHLYENNDEKIYQFKEYDENSHSFLYAMHKGYMYYATDNGGIHKVNLTSYKEEKFIENIENTKCYAMFFYEDYVYLCLEKYDGDNLLSDELYKVDLNTYEKEFIMSTKGVYHVDLDNIIYIGEDASTYIYNMKNDEHKKLIDDYVVWVYRADNYYVIDGVGISDNTPGYMYIVDLNGKILDQKEGFSTLHRFSQGVINDKYYLYDEDKNQFVYYPIVDEKFEEMKIVENITDYKK